MEMIVPIAILAAVGLAVEVVRWKLRPEGRRLRAIKKIGGRR